MAEDVEQQAAQALQDLLRQHYAMQQPKAHIPLGIGAFLVLSALSAVPAVPFIGAGLVAADAVRRLRKNRKIVTDSYRDPSVLTKGLKKDQLESVNAFVQAFVSPKALPLAETPGEKTIVWETEVNPVIESEVYPVVEPEPTPEPMPMPESEGWRPQELPCSLPEFLARQIHILISATTGSGKTHMLQCLCGILAARGDLLLICDPKGSRWGQLEPAVRRMQSGSDYLAIASDLNKELDRRIERNKEGKGVGAHVWVVFDEWTLLKCFCTSLTNDGRQLFQRQIVRLIVAGRELNMHLVMVNQSHQISDLALVTGGFSSTIRDNLCTLGLGCKTTKDHEGGLMEGSDKSINAMLQDSWLMRLASDRIAAQAYHTELRRQPTVNRTYCLYANSLRIGAVPELPIPAVDKVRCFYDADEASSPEPS